jgi:pimeloyl-ACP methyl ester carboxylesterase
MGTFLLYVAAVLVLAYAGWGLALLFLQSRLTFQPMREVSATPAGLGLAFEEVAFSSTDGVRLSGWYVPAEMDRQPAGGYAARIDDAGPQVRQDAFGELGGRPAAPPDATARRNEPRHRPAPAAAFTLLVCHGTGGNIMYVLDTIELFQGLGLNCLVFDYRGYGRSAGRPTEAGTYLDAQGAWDWLVREKHVPPEGIIVFGHSLGGSIAAHLAGRVRPGGLVIEGAFTSYRDMGAHLYPYLPVRPFARFRYDTRAYLREVRCPVLVIHSREDELVPFKFGLRLFEAAPEPKQFVEIRGGHIDGSLVSRPAYEEAWTRWLSFLEDCRLTLAAQETP